MLQYLGMGQHCISSGASQVSNLRVLICSRNSRHIRTTSGISRCRRAGIESRVPHTGRSSIFSTKRIVQDNLVALKVLVDDTRALHVGKGEAPGRRVRVSTENVAGNGTSHKEPDTNVVGGPLHGVHTTSSYIEACAEAGCAIVAYTAANIVPRLRMGQQNQ